MNEAAALEAVERIVNRGGEPQEVVHAVAIALRERDFDATAVGRSLRIAEADEAFAARVATLLSPYTARL
jgi:hypothetical protein